MAANKQQPWTQRVKDELEQLRVENAKLHEANGILAEKVNALTTQAEMESDRSAALLDELLELKSQAAKRWWHVFTQ